MILTVLGVLFVVVGTVISIIFWIPGIIDRKQLKKIMGNRYPMIFFIYITNGPVLLAIGAVILTSMR